MPNKQKVAIIGAGAAGLCAGRYASQSGHEVTIFEQTGEIGGTWVYTDRVGEDEYGLKIHTSMYKNLLTNSPLNLTEFSGFPMTSDPDHAYIESDKVLDYLKKFTEHFDLMGLIRFRHYVIRVRPVEKNQWEVIVKDLANDHVETIIFDAIFVCNGRYFAPNIPQIPDMDKFKGIQLHSHDYRRAEDYQGKDVLIIGSGSSGHDLSIHIEKYAKSVTISSRDPQKLKNHKIPENILVKGIVIKIRESGAVFEDGTEKSFDVIIYCTGFKYSFPFLSVDCDIHVDQNYIYPLYRHCINIAHPTMYFTNIPFMTNTIPVIDIQVRYCIKFLNKEASLPSIDQMLQHTENHIKDRQSKGIPKNKWHSLEIFGQRAYFDELAKEANIENVPDVLLQITYHALSIMQIDYPNFRKYYYKIIDNNHFESIFKPDA